jgi:Zn-dependent M32 family carboxypeptidase
MTNDNEITEKRISLRLKGESLKAFNILADKLHADSDSEVIIYSIKTLAYSSGAVSQAKEDILLKKKMLNLVERADLEVLKPVSPETPKRKRRFTDAQIEEKIEIIRRKAIINKFQPCPKHTSGFFTTCHCDQNDYQAIKQFYEEQYDDVRETAAVPVRESPFHEEGGSDKAESTPALGSGGQVENISMPNV